MKALGPLEEPLDQLAPIEELPPAWSGAHVALRLTEGFTTMLRQSMRGGPASLLTAWPVILHEFEDLVAQQQQGELEHTHEQQNRVRIVPSAKEIEHSDSSVYWSVQYLGAEVELRLAVNMIGLARALGLDAGCVAKKRGGFADTWRDRHDRGCEPIARVLIRDRVQVF